MQPFDRVRLRSKSLSITIIKYLGYNYIGDWSIYLPRRPWLGKLHFVSFIGSSPLSIEQCRPEMKKSEKNIWLRFVCNASTIERIAFILQSRVHLVRIAQNKNDGITTQKHLWNKSILVDWLGFFLSLAWLWGFSPHFLHVFQDPYQKDMENYYSSGKAKRSIAPHGYFSEIRNVCAPPPPSAF